MTLNAELQEHIGRVIGRCRTFYAARDPGHALLTVKVPFEAPPVPPLYGVDLETGLEDWMDSNLEAARAGWRAAAGLDDDSVPAFCPRFGIAEHTAWLGSEVRLQADTCLPVPLLHEPGDLSPLRVSEDTPWYRYMRRSYEHLRRRQDGSFVLSVRGAMMPMDIANGLRGDDIFTDFVLRPESVHRLLRFLTDAIAWYYPRLRGWADSFESGYFMMYNNSWMGPDAFGHVTNDAAMLCNPRVYEEFGYPYERELSAHFGAVLYHVHNQKMHFVPRVAQLPNMALLEVTNDPKTKTALEDLPRVLAATGACNLFLHATSDEVRKHLPALAERNVYLEVTCTDYQDARDVIEWVRGHTRPLN